MVKRIRGKPKQLPSEAELKQLYLEERKSMIQIGRMYHTSGLKIRELLVTHRIKIRKQGDWASGLTKDTHSGLKRSADSKRGVPRDAATLKKISEKLTGKPSPKKGIPVSKTAYENMQKSNTFFEKGHPPNETSYKPGRKSEFAGQTKETNSTILKRSITATGKKRTEKHKKTMSVSRKKLLKENPEILEKLKPTQFKKGDPPHNAGRKASEDEKEHLKKIGFKKGDVPHNAGVPRNQWMSPEGEVIVREAQRNAKPNHPTDIELIMKKTLDKLDITYLQYANKLPGRPDFLIKPNICIFCDGDFDHANPNSRYADGRTKYNLDTVLRKAEPEKNRAARIVKDVWAKDDRITKELEQLGYTVLRFWGADINKNLDSCIEEILKAIKKSKTHVGS